MSERCVNSSGSPMSGSPPRKRRRLTLSPAKRRPWRRSGRSIKSENQGNRGGSIGVCTYEGGERGGGGEYVHKCMKGYIYIEQMSLIKGLTRYLQVEIKPVET